MDGLQNLYNPLFLAVLIGWIMTVVLHEFAHGLVAHFGGDSTIKARGGLSLDPLQYVHPVTTILLPALFLITGGVPLPGGATYIRVDLLRSRLWQAMVSAAGPLTNFLLFLALALPFHPALHWIRPAFDARQWTLAQQFLGALAFLQLFSVFINLLPMPPLDGFGICLPFLPPPAQNTLRQNNAAVAGFCVLFLLLRSPVALLRLMLLMRSTVSVLGFDDENWSFFLNSFRHTLRVA